MWAIEEIDGSLVWTETSPPVAGPGEIRVRVQASAVNRADLVQRAGHYPPPPGASLILGLECAGVVDQLGSGVEWPKVGEPVCALLSGGGYAEYAVFPASHALPIPTGLTMNEAAALPEVFTTAWLNLRREGGLQKGERVLVHAAASGVGTAALQLCRAWGNPTFATVGSAEKARRCQELGAEECADRHDGPWLAKVKAWGPVDVILDPVGGEYLEPNILCLRSGGRLINIGLMGGGGGSLQLGLVLVKRLTIRGSVLRSRSDDEKTEILAGVRREVWPLFESGQLHPIVERSFPITEVEEAHRLLASNQTFGKLILEIPG